MGLHWYALRSKSRKEEIVWKQVRDKGFDVFYPRLRVNPVNPRAQKVKPYFPGYMFIRVDLESTGLSILQWMPHSLGIVLFGGEPAIVPDNLVIAIQHRIDEIAQAGGILFDGLRSGDQVRIHHGPFEGYEAIFDARIPGTERVRVLLRLISERQVPVEMDVSQIERNDRPKKGKRSTSLD